MERSAESRRRQAGISFPVTFCYVILAARRSKGLGRPSVSSRTHACSARILWTCSSSKMEDKMEAQARGLHPLVAGAAAAVILAAGVAVAAITGYLPGSKADVAPQKALTSHSAKPAQPRQQVAAACHDCGVIVEVKEVEVLGKGTGIGAVAGGVGGAVAEHQIERQARKHTRYDITVRMND